MKRTILALAGTALLLVGCSSGEEVTETVTVTAGATGVSTTSDVKLPSRVPDLRTAVDKLWAQTQSMDTSSPAYLEQFKQLMNTYAVPTCAQIMIGFAEAFGGGETEPSDSTLVSVNQTGTTGITVERDSDGVEDTLHWLYTDGSWKFTCEGVFDDTTEAEAPAIEDPAPIEVTPEVEDPAVAGQEAWGDCIAEGNTPAECREIVDGG
jgi:hypothetical protein